MASFPRLEVWDFGSLDKRAQVGVDQECLDDLIMKNSKESCIKNWKIDGNKKQLIGGCGLNAIWIIEKMKNL